MTAGRIIKNFNGYYYVETPDKELVTCKIKGKMKQVRFSAVTGDMVEFEKNPDGESMIKTILPRRNFMERPAMANLDCIVIAFACADPDFSYLLADKMLAFAERAGIEAVLCLNKTDLVSEAQLEEIAGVYRKAGYTVFTVSTFNGTGLEALKEYLNGKISAFAGPSGVGKSSMLNALQPGIALQTGKVSEKSGAGGIQLVMPSFCRLTAATLPIHPVLAICWPKISTRASFISIFVNLSILSTAANLFRARIRMNRSAV